MYNEQMEETPQNGDDSKEGIIQHEERKLVHDNRHLEWAVGAIVIVVLSLLGFGVYKVMQGKQSSEQIETAIKENTSAELDTLDTTS